MLDELLPLNDDMTWSVYQGSKGLAIFLSIMLFFLVSKNYHHKERDEIVNEQQSLRNIMRESYYSTHHASQDMNLKTVDTTNDSL